MSNTFSFSRLLSAALLVSLTTVIAAGCKKDKQAPPPTAPLIKTAAITNVAGGNATAGGSIVSDGGATVTASGVVWSKTNTTPTLTDSVVAGTATTGAFTVNISGLNFSNTYYVRAFATNSAGTGYGDVVAIGAGSDTSKVRFTYNGQEVAYGIIISPTTGKKWLDRNLGAAQAATAFDDYKAYGDLFQWGRPADGHQLMNWTASTTGTPVNGMTATIATSDNPGHNMFIDGTTNFDPSTGVGGCDWRDNNNRNRWATNPQGPCPTGWHVPTVNEWQAEATGMPNPLKAYIQLKLTVSGERLGLDANGTGTAGQLMDGGHGPGTGGAYWCSTDGLHTSLPFNMGLTLDLSPVQVGDDRLPKSYGCPVRCIKDN